MLPSFAACSGGHVGTDPCAERECGQAGGQDCGSCPGATERCDAQGQCVDVCAGRECGEVQGVDCGSCAGETELCDEQRRCVDLCAERDCGSPAPGIHCGECTAPERCGLAGRCYTPGGCPGGTVEIPDQGYCIDAYEVTNEQMYEFMVEHGNECVVEEISYTNPEWPDASFCMGDATYEKYKLWLDEGTWRIRPGYEQHPVVGVTWQGAVTACRAWGGDLCTLPQWQLACSGPQGYLFPYGDEYDGNACNACYWEQVCDPTGGTVEVGSFPGCEGGYPGIFDMSGNVFEWLWECKEVGDGADHLCVHVGGFWSGPSLDKGACFEPPERDWDWELPYHKNEATGFRCCYELP